MVNQFISIPKAISFTPLILVTITSIMISLPLLKPGIHQIHDDQQIARLYLFDQAVKSGQFPVRWVDKLGFGFGYPLFVFYPPLVYLLGEIYHIVGFDFINSVKLVFFTSIILSGIGMYIFIKELWGRYAALTGAIFYVLVPYRAIDMYVRGALAESFSFVWLPLILWSLYKLQKTGRSAYIYLSAVFLAFLMITHNLIFLPFMSILPFYLLFLIWQSQYKKTLILHSLFSILFAFALSAFFWLPALFEKKYTIVDQLLLVNLASYQIHFVYPQQLWNWPWGFGGSSAGLADGISFKIGKLHILVSIFALILTTIHVFKNSKSKFILHTSYFILLIFVLFTFSAFMTTFYSKPIWDLITPLSYLQFPWRYLTFTALFSSILAGALIYLLRVPVLKLIATAILIVLVFIPNLKLFKPQAYRENLTDQIATSKGVINWDVSSSSFEYIPLGVELAKSGLGTNIVNIGKSDIPREKVEILSGNAKIANLLSKPHEISLTIEAKDDSKIRANIFNFPGWQAKVDNRKIEIDDNNRLRLIDLNIQRGSHQVTIEFKDTPTRQIANLISLVSVLFLSFLIINKWPKTTTT